MESNGIQATSILEILTCITFFSPLSITLQLIPYSFGSMEVLVVPHCQGLYMSMVHFWQMTPSDSYHTTLIHGTKKQMLYTSNLHLKQVFHTWIINKKILLGQTKLQLNSTEMQSWNFIRYGHNSKEHKLTQPDKVTQAFTYQPQSMSNFHINIQNSRTQ